MRADAGAQTGFRGKLFRFSVVIGHALGMNLPNPFGLGPFQPLFTMQILKTLFVGACCVAPLTGFAQRNPNFGGPGPGFGVNVEVLLGPPPAAVRERPGRQPGPDYVWIEGHYVGQPGGWAWVPGHWALRPQREAIWVAGHYDLRGGGYVWVEGEWKVPAAAPVVVETPAIVVGGDVPPAPMVEARPPSPGRGFGWIEGHWVRDRRGWVWTSGRWERKPREGLVWRPGHLEIRAGAWVYVEGDWVDDPMAVVVQSPGQPLPPAPEVIVTEAPPAPVAEQIPPSADPSQVWRGGHWAWQGQWVWMGGQWMTPPQPGLTWVSGNWETRPTGWAWREGYWTMPTPASPTELIVPSAPPQPLVEYIPPTADVDVIWVGGHWAWNNAWVWAPGGYVRNIRPGGAFTPGHWEERPGRGWVWREGGFR
jgi:hypothetical protein